MGRICYVHWNEAELEERAGPLRAAGHEVHGHASTVDHLALGEFVPETVVISLDRLPSHGRAVAEWFWEARKRRVIPLVFAGGRPDKVEATRLKFPAAVFCASDEVPRVVAELLSARSG